MQNIIECVATTTTTHEIFFLFMMYAFMVCIYRYNKFGQEKEKKEQSSSLCYKCLSSTDVIAFLTSSAIVTERCRVALPRRDIEAVLTMIERNFMTMLTCNYQCKGETVSQMSFHNKTLVSTYGDTLITMTCKLACICLLMMMLISS